MLNNVVGSVARGEDFYDREELVDALWGRLGAGNVLLAAPRRFGKTSLMYRLIDFPRHGWHPIHVDAESIREPANFVIALVDALMGDRRIREFLVARWKRLGKWVRDILTSLEITTPYDVGVKIALKEKIGPHWEERGAALLRTLRDYDKDQRLLLIIDELPVMLRLFEDSDVSDADTRAFLYWFRKLRTDPKVGLTNCRFLVGGSIGIEHTLSRLRVADSFNDFERLAVGELAPERAPEFLRLLLKSRKVALSAAAQREMLRLVGAPIPYFIQVFVSEVAMAAATGAARIGPKRLREIYADRVLGATCKTYFQHYYDRLRAYERPLEHGAKAMLKALAIAYPEPVPRANLRHLLREALGRSAGDDDLIGLLGDLENDFYIRCQSDGEGYAFASKILCDWWRRYCAF